jgi:SAM-dependent methyltransferase
MNSPWVVPYVQKKAISLIAIGGDALEAMALRSVLERFNYRVEVQWVGSRQEVLEILRGHIETFPNVILSCHGDERGGVLVPNEPVIAVDDLAICLPERLVLNLGCGTGQVDAAAQYLQGGCRAFIAPREAVDANNALMFAIHIFYFLAHQHTLADAVRLSRQHDAECALFELWER